MGVQGSFSRAEGALLLDDNFGMGAAGGGARSTFAWTFGIKVKNQGQGQRQRTGVSVPHGRRFAPLTAPSTPLRAGEAAVST